MSKSNVEKLFECPYFGVHKEKIEYKNGIKADYFTIDADDFVVVIPYLYDSMFVMIEQTRPVCKSKSLEFPAGAINKGESPIFAAMRELKEETGYNTKNITLLGSFKPIISRSNMTGYIFLATELIAGKQDLEDTEELEVLHLLKEELINYIDQGIIIDATSLVAWLKFINIRNKNE